MVCQYPPQESPSLGDSTAMGMQHLGTQLRVALAVLVGLDDLRGLFQPQQLHGQTGIWDMDNRSATSWCLCGSQVGFVAPQPPLSACGTRTEHLN